MDSRYVVANVAEALRARLFPTVTVWNRLEGRPRTENFARALKAEVRDALWMLTKQWQMGEFRGDDAGTPVFAKVHLATTQLTKYRAKEHAVEGFENDVPLEAKVFNQDLFNNLRNRLKTVFSHHDRSRVKIHGHRGARRL